MKLPAYVKYRKEERLFIWRPRGVINEAAVTKVIGVLGNLEAEAREGFNRFIDTLAADTIDLNVRFIFNVSLFRRLSYRGPPVKSALLVAKANRALYSQMHVLLTQGSLLKVRKFEKREAAAKWLDVPDEWLEPRDEFHLS